MDAEQFFFEVTRELVEIEDANSYLQRISEQLIQERIDEEYREFTKSWMKELYDEIYDDSFTWA